MCDSAHNARCVSGDRSRYELTGDEGRITALRAYTPPAGHAPVIRIESGKGVEERTLPPADQFAAVVRRFVSRARDGVPSDLEGQAIVAQAALVDRIREQAVLLPDPEVSPRSAVCNRTRTF